MTPEGNTAILAIDPGVTTGVAYMENGVVLWTDVSVAPWTLLRLQVRRFRRGKVVAEKGPSFLRHHQEAINRVERILEEEAENVEWVLPAQWKNTPPVKAATFTGESQHEKDAEGIAHWFNWSHEETARAGNTS